VVVVVVDMCGHGFVDVVDVCARVCAAWCLDPFTGVP